MNFKEYIEKDIEEKKSLLGLLPLNTVARVNKYKDKIDEIVAIYQKSISGTRKFIDYKFDKLFPVQVDRSDSIKQVSAMRESFKSLLKAENTITSFYEKLGFDDLIFSLEHYYDYSLEENNQVIKEIISKFAFANCRISINDFRLNPYSYNYMHYIFLSINQVEVSEDIFKKIFWKCPKVFDNIIVNFRILFNSYERQFNFFIKDYEMRLLRSNGFSTRHDLIQQYHNLSKQLDDLQDDDEADIILKFMSGDLDFGLYKDAIANLFSEFDYFFINPIDVSDKRVVDEAMDKIQNFNDNINEYGVYKLNEPLLNSFKTMFTKNVESVDMKKLNADFKAQKKLIAKLHRQAKKLYVHKMFDLSSIESCFNPKEANMVLDQQKILNDLYTEYTKYDKMYFDIVLKKNITSNSFASDVIYVIISYPFFTYSIIKKEFEFETRNEVTTKYDELFEMYFNRKRKIIDLKSFFSKDDFERSLMDAFRFDNLNVNESTFEEDGRNLVSTNYQKLFNKSKIVNFTRSIEEIDFLIKVQKLKDDERLE